MKIGAIENAGKIALEQSRLRRTLAKEFLEEAMR